MAKALQCPSCGTKTRLEGVETDTFRCQQCGQVLKVPPTARRAAPAGAAAAGVTDAAGVAAPPPRRRASMPDDPGPAVEPPRRPVSPPAFSAPVAASPPVVTAAGGTAVIAEHGGPPIAPPPTKGRGDRGARPPRDALPLAMRLGAWVLAVPIGLAIVGLPARKLGYLTSQKLLDVFVKHTLSRFVPLLVVVVVWALATTVLVEVFVEGGRWIMLRRQRRAGANAPDAFAADAPYPSSAPSPPPRGRRSSRRSRGT